MGPAASRMWWRRHLHTLNSLVTFVTVAFGVEATQDFVPPRMPPTFWFNTDLTSSVNAHLVYIIWVYIIPGICLPYIGPKSVLSLILVSGWYQIRLISDQYLFEPVLYISTLEENLFQSQLHINFLVQWHYETSYSFLGSFFY